MPNASPVRKAELNPLGTEFFSSLQFWNEKRGENHSRPFVSDSTYSLFKLLSRAQPETSEKQRICHSERREEAKEFNTIKEQDSSLALRMIGKGTF